MIGEEVRLGAYSQLLAGLLHRCVLLFALEITHDDTQNALEAVSCAHVHPAPWHMDCKAVLYSPLRANSVLTEGLLAEWQCGTPQRSVSNFCLWYTARSTHLAPLGAISHSRSTKPNTPVCRHEGRTQC